MVAKTTKKKPAKKSASAKKTGAKKAPAKKTAAKKAPAKKATAKKAPAKKATAKKAPAKKAAAKKPAPKKAAAKKASPKKAAAKKPVAEKAVVKEPVVEKPVAEKAPEPAAAKPVSGIRSTQVVLAHLFALRPRVATSFKPDHFRQAKQQLEDESYESIDEAARAVAEKALELTGSGLPKRLKRR